MTVCASAKATVPSRSIGVSSASCALSQSRPECVPQKFSAGLYSSSTRQMEYFEGVARRAHEDEADVLIPEHAEAAPAAGHHVAVGGVSRAEQKMALADRFKYAVKLRGEDLFEFHSNRSFGGLSGAARCRSAISIIPRPRQNYNRKLTPAAVIRVRNLDLNYAGRCAILYYIIPYVCAKARAI